MAVVEVPKVKIESIGLRPFHEFDQANDTWPRGDRPAAIREAAAEFRARFATPENQVRAVRTVKGRPGRPRGCRRSEGGEQGDGSEQLHGTPREVACGREPDEYKASSTGIRVKSREECDQGKWMPTVIGRSHHVRGVRGVRRIGAGSGPVDWEALPAVRKA